MLAGSDAVHVRQAVRSRLGVAPSRSGDGIGCPVRVAGRREPEKGELLRGRACHEPTQAGSWLRPAQDRLWPTPRRPAQGIPHLPAGSRGSGAG
jgi:hypothetical protein